MIPQYSIQSGFNSNPFEYTEDILRDCYKKRTMNKIYEYALLIIGSTSVNLATVDASLRILLGEEYINSLSVVGMSAGIIVLLACKIENSQNHLNTKISNLEKELQ